MDSQYQFDLGIHIANLTSGFASRVNLQFASTLELPSRFDLQIHVSLRILIPNLTTGFPSIWKLVPPKLHQNFLKGLYYTYLDDEVCGMFCC